MANYWILKTDADTYAFDQLVRDRRTVWDGVSNALPLKHIRSMPKGDPLFNSHSGDEKALVGTARRGLSKPRHEPDMSGTIEPPSTPTRNYRRV